MDYQSVSERFEPIKYYPKTVSITVPDMSFTPREILAKFSRGEKVPLGFNGLYDSEESEDDPTFRGYDPAIFEEDPTRDPAFDFGDYVEESHALKERQKQEKRRAKMKQLAESKRKASAEELSASDATKRETTSEEAASAPTGQAAKSAPGSS